MLPSRLFLDNFLEDFEPKKNDKMMKCDIYEEGDRYHIVVDLPGIKKEDVHLEFEKGYLKIVAENKLEEKNDKKYVHRERTSMSRYERSFYLGDVDEKNIKAEFKNGVLKISLPKETKEEHSKKFIQID